MASFVQAVGDQGARAASAVTRSIVPVSPLFWGVIPGFIVGVLILVLCIFLRIPLKGSGEVDVCSGEGENEECSTEPYNYKWNLLIYIFAPLIGGGIAGGSFYKLGFMIKNPKMGATIVGTRLAGEAAGSAVGSLRQGFYGDGGRRIQAPKRGGKRGRRSRGKGRRR